MRSWLRAGSCGCAAQFGDVVSKGRQRRSEPEVHNSSSSPQVRLSQWPKPAPQNPPKRRAQSVEGQEFLSGKRKVDEDTHVRLGSCQRRHETPRCQTLRHRYGITSGQKDGKLRSKPPSTFALLSAAGTKVPKRSAPNKGRSSAKCSALNPRSSTTR